MSVSVWVLVVLLVGLAAGCVRKEPRKGNPLDGTLKCYQCTSGNSPDDRCRFRNWKYTNRSERRYMEMQCPRKSSAFCLLKIPLQDEDRVERGCFKNRYPGNKKEAFEGCFHMGDQYRACLCTKPLCNAAATQRATLSLIVDVSWSIVASLVDVSWSIVRSLVDVRWSIVASLVDVSWSIVASLVDVSWSIDVD